MPEMGSQKGCTFGGLLSMEDGDWCELYDGALCPVKPASIAHEAVRTELKGQLWYFLRGQDVPAVWSAVARSSVGRGE